MPSRFLKQCIFGIFYLVLCGAVGYGLFVFFVRPAPTCFDNRRNGSEVGVDCGGSCVSCEIKRLTPLQVSAASIFNIKDKETTVLFELRNPNVHYGADRVDYLLDLFEAGGATTTSLAGSTFIYPGEIKVLLRVGIPVVPTRAVRAVLRIGDISWKPSTVFLAPLLELRQVNVVTEISYTRAIVTGIVSNASPSTIKRLVVNVLLGDALLGKIGASQTVLENLTPAEARLFQVTVPGITSPAITRDQIKIFLEAKQE